MPIYVFKCTCGKKFDEIVPMGTTEAKCPGCGAQAAKAGVENFLFAAMGLENGHIATGHKLTGKDKAATSGATEG